jgi:hypothetical protein
VAALSKAVTSLRYQTKDARESFVLPKTYRTAILKAAATEDAQNRVDDRATIFNHNK